MLESIGNAFLALFAIDAGLSVLDELLKSAGFEGLPLLRDLFALTVFVALPPLYLLVAASQRLPAAIFLPPILVGAWLNLGAAPLYLAFADAANRALAGSLIQLATAALAYATVYARSGWRSGMLGPTADAGPAFVPARFACFAGAAVVLGPLLLATYAAVGLTTWIDFSTAGFVRVDRDGIHLSERHYQRGDHAIRLVAMMHIGPRAVYEQIFASFELPETVVLEEGITDESQLLEADFSYQKLAEKLDLIEQERLQAPEQPGEWPHLRHRDMDVSDFSPETLDFVRKMGLLINALDDPETLRQKLEDPAALPQNSEAVMHEILMRRNQLVLKAIEAALLDYERVIVPWGALHMPWLEEQIERRGFEQTGSQRHRFVDWNRIRNAIRKAVDWWALLDSNQGPSGYEPGALTAELRARADESSSHSPIGDDALVADSRSWQHAAQ